jgi:hypothetical protein
MKSLAIHTLAMAVTITLWATTSMAGEVSNLPTRSSEKHSTSATAPSPAPLFALSGLDAQTLADQRMTDQELKAVEGGYFGVYAGMYITLSEQVNGTVFVGCTNGGTCIFSGPWR